MTVDQISNILKKLGMPVSYHHFNTPQKPPFIVFYATGADSFGADDKTYSKTDRMNIELYTAKKFPALEEKTERALDAAGIYYDKSEAYIQSEELYQILYEI